MSVVIFLGPTMPVEEARSILDAEYRPPARQGDLLSVAAMHRPKVIGLVDGVFLQSMAVWHKEILYAIEQGIHVFGASSMGALRAAEIAPFGMKGVGEVYELYASGALMDDDEVALAHEPTELGYKKLSEPLVNLRFTFRRAQQEGLVEPDEHDRLLEIAKQLHFSDRVIPVILHRAQQAGIAEEKIGRLREFCDDRYVDIKKLDARRLLETIRELPSDLPPIEPVERTRRTSAFETMYNRDRLVGVEGIEIPMAAIANHAAVSDPGFAVTHFNALNRFMTVALAKLLHVEVGDDEVGHESERFRNRLALQDDERFGEWLARNHLTRDEFRVLMVETALCRRMHRWFTYARWTQRTTSILLDQLRFEGRYEEWATRASSQERLLQLGEQSFDAVEDWRHETDKLVKEHQAWTDVRFDTDPTTWAEDAGFHSKKDLKLELLRARSARITMLGKLAEGMVLDRLNQARESGDEADPDGEAGPGAADDDG